MKLNFFKTVKTHAIPKSKPNSLLIDYHLAERFDYSEDWGCVAKVKEHPLYLRDYCRVSEKLFTSGYYPIVHGQHSLWMILQIILKALGYKGFEMFRPIHPSSNQKHIDVGLEIYNEIKALRHKENIHSSYSQMKSWGKMALVEMAFFDSLRNHIPIIHDHHEHIRHQVLSATIGLFHTHVNESPLYLTFGSRAHKASSGFFIPSQKGNQSILPMIKCKTISNLIIRDAMLKAHYSEEHISKLIQALNPLYEAAHSLDIGQLIVIGIPKEIAHEDHYLYHSRRYGIPTGESIPRILKTLTSGQPIACDLQVRLLLQKKRYLDISQLPVINIMNIDEVNEYCDQQILTTPDTNLVLKTIYGEEAMANISPIIHHASSSTMVEEENRKKYNQVRNDVEDIIKHHLGNFQAVSQKY